MWPAYRVCRVTCWNFERTPLDRSCIYTKKIVLIDVLHQWRPENNVLVKKKTNKHNFIETSVTASFLSSFFPSRLELFCSMADVSCVNSQVGHLSVAYFFFSCHQDLHCLYFCFTELQWAGFRTRFQCEIWANMLQLFSSPRPATCRASGVSETYKIILFPWRYTRPFWLQTANQY